MPTQIKDPREIARRTGPKIALVRLSAIGDVIHAMPCATALREAQPDAEIIWIAEPVPAQLLSRHPDLDGVITMPRRRWRKMSRTLAGRREAWRERKAWFRHLRMAGFDIAVDLQGLWKSSRVARGTLATDRFCFGDDQARELSWFGVPRQNRILPPPEAQHVVERYLALLKPLGVESLTPTWRFGPLPQEAIDWLGAWWPEQEGHGSWPWVALNPGAGWETKRWPIAKFAELAERIEEDLGARSIFIWGPAERDLREELMTRHEGERFAHLPDNDLHQLRAFLPGCAVFVGGDTGNTHLAAALGVPCVAPHGGSDWMRNGPYGEEHISLAVEEVPCVPCWRTTCNYVKRLECLERLTVDRLLEAVKAQMERPGRGLPPKELLAETTFAGRSPVAPPAEG